MDKKSRRPSEERPGYSEEETKAIREMMENDSIPEETKDEFIRQAAAEVRKSWSESEKLRRMGFLFTDPDPVEIFEWITTPERRRSILAPHESDTD